MTSRFRLLDVESLWLLLTLMGLVLASRWLLFYILRNCTSAVPIRAGCPPIDCLRRSFPLLEKHCFVVSYPKSSVGYGCNVVWFPWRSTNWKRHTPIWTLDRLFCLFSFVLQVSSNVCNLQYPSSLKRMGWAKRNLNHECYTTDSYKHSCSCSCFGKSRGYSQKKIVLEKKIAQRTSFKRVVNEWSLLLHSMLKLHLHR